MPVGDWRVGEVNRNGLRLVRKTNTMSPNHRYARMWVVCCEKCTHEFGANSCDFHDRKCPCQGAKAGFPIPEAALNSDRDETRSRLGQHRTSLKLRATTAELSGTPPYNRRHFGGPCSDPLSRVR